MARNRKRAKERRARRPEPVVSGRSEREDAPPGPIRHAAPDAELADAQLALGRPDLADDGEPPASEEELEELAVEAAPAHRSDRGRTAAAAPGAQLEPHRPGPANRVVTFMQGSWRELQRVQWPDRRQVMQATGVVIGFVIVAGLYLGLADFVSTKLMNLILK